MIRTATAVLFAPALVLPVITVSPSHAETAAVNGQIVYSRVAADFSSAVYLMNGDGTEQTRLTVGTDDAYPSFSPDGDQIVFVSARGDNVDIYLMNLDGTNQRRLTNHPGREDSPSFSPDGQQVVFSSTRDGDREIYRVNTDGSSETRITSNSWWDSEPRFSPDGQHIVFVSDRPAANLPRMNEDVFRIAVDGTDEHRLTSTALEDEASPSYSPDGSHIVFTRDGELYRMDTNGLNANRIATAGSVLIPNYSPDGQYLAFVSYRGHGAEIFRINADGSNEIQLTNNEVDDFSPAWRALSNRCSGVEATIVGTEGNDVLTGGQGPDVIFGHGGDDVIDGGGGADVICGGSGTDTVTYAKRELDVVADLDGGATDDGSAEDGPPGVRDSISADVEQLVGGYGDDALIGGPGANVLTGGPGDDVLTGDDGNDTLTGDSGDDTLLGEEGKDRLRGRSGLDSIKGGDGDDSLDGGDDADTLDGGPGVDTATYAARDSGVSASLGAGTGDDGNAVDGPRGHRDTLRNTVERLVGGRGDDVLVGSLLDNRLTGGLGADRLLGRAGRDVLVADDGIADLLIDCGDDTDRAPTIDPGIDPAPVSCP